MPDIAQKLRSLFPGSLIKHETPTYSPPPGPPPNHINEKPIHSPPPGSPKLVDFPFLSEEQVLTLYNQGFARVHLPADHPLLNAATALFSTSRAFFDQTLDEKQKFHRSQLPSDPCADGSKSQGHSSEQGWSRVEGEKEMLTIRRTSKLCPPGVTENTRNLWRECGSFMQLMVQAIEASLELKSGSFDNVVTDECVLPVEEVHETLLRMFRYERASEPRVVSQKHRDIGLLSLVIGSSPGLEVWDSTIVRKDATTGVVSKGDWVAIEEDGNERKSDGGLTLTFLIGETLTALTNNLYKPGVHRVSVPPADPSSLTDDSKYRYSLVFALRPHRNATIFTPSLTTAVTGEFTWPRKDEKGAIRTVNAADLFGLIANMHWSVNDQVEEREAKRIRLEKEREAKAQRALMQG
jgi:isopenicillin N synthase-like dioxygenase